MLERTTAAGASTATAAENTAQTAIVYRLICQNCNPSVIGKGASK
jgi:hypothetical protein